MNILHDKNHYKLALGQINTTKHLIDSVAKDYVRLMMGCCSQGFASNCQY